jgi:hypothetical protein
LLKPTPSSPSSCLISCVNPGNTAYTLLTKEAISSIIFRKLSCEQGCSFNDPSEARTSWWRSHHDVGEAHTSSGLRPDDYSKYNNFELLDETVILLKKANIQILGQHYDKFKEMEYSCKYKITTNIKTSKKKINKKPFDQRDDYDEITKIFLIMVTNEEFFNIIEKLIENPDNDNDYDILLEAQSAALRAKFKQINKKDICIIKIGLQYLKTIGLKKFNDDEILKKKKIINNIKNDEKRSIY